MLTYQGCPQTPGGRIRALGFARMGARGRRRGPIQAVCHCYSSPVLHGQPSGPGFARMGVGRGPRAGAMGCAFFPVRRSHARGA